MGRAPTSDPTDPAAGPAELLGDERLTVMGLFAETFVGLAARLECDLARHGLSAVEFEVLIRLARSPGQRLRMSDLTAQTALSSSGVTRVVDRLERQGRVRRQSCAEDRRSTWAVLTEEGEAAVLAALPGHLELIETWLTGRLAPAERDALVATLRRLRDAVHPGAVAGVAEPSGDRRQERGEPAQQPAQAGRRSRR